MMYNLLNGPRPYTPDATDLNIMSVLQDNAWMTVDQVGKKVHKSNSATAERIRKLVQFGYIRQFTALLNRHLLGRPVMMITLVKLKEHGAGILNAFGDDMTGLEEVNVCLHLSGEYDFILQVTVDSPEAYEMFLQTRLCCLPVVDKIHSSLVLKEKKMNMTIPLHA